MKHIKPIRFWQPGQIATYIAVLVFVIMSGLKPVTAAETSADVEAYCQKTYGPGASAGTDRRDNGPLCTEKKALSLIHHKVDPADICQTLHNTGNYRQEGPQIFCITGDQDSLQDRKVELADYCRKNYGQSAIVSKRLSDNAPLCTVKGDGGLSQTHYAIDLAQLCGRDAAVGPGAVDDKDVLDCALGPRGSDAGATSGGQPRPGKEASGNDPIGGGTTPRSPGGNNNVPQSAILLAADEPDLDGCGIPPSPELLALGWGKSYGKLLPPSFNAETDLAPGSKRRQELMLEFSKAGMWMSGGALSPCPSLTGGLVVEIAEICRLDSVNSILGWVPHGPTGQRPVCHAPDAEPNTTYSGTPLIRGCYDLYPNQDALRRPGKDESGNDIVEGRLYPIMKWTGTSQIECFYLDITGEPDEEPDKTVEVET